MNSPLKNKKKIINHRRHRKTLKEEKRKRINYYAVNLIIIGFAFLFQCSSVLSVVGIPAFIILSLISILDRQSAHLLELIQ